MNSVCFPNHPLSTPALFVSLGLTAGYGLVSTGYAMAVVNTLAQKILGSSFRGQPSNQCGERRIQLASPAASAHLTQSGSEWKINIEHPNGVSNTISLGSHIYGSPKIASHGDGLISLVAHQAGEGSSHRFQVIAHLYDANGGPLGQPLVLSPPIPFNPAHVETPIEALSLEGGTAVGWQELNEFAGAIINRTGAITPFHRTGIHPSDGPPMLVDLDGRLALSWSDIDPEATPQIAHYIDRFDPVIRRFEGAALIGDRLPGGTPGLEPRLGNIRDRDVLFLGKGRFVHAWVRDRAAQAAHNVSVALFGAKNNLLQKFSMIAPSIGKECSPKIQRLAAEKFAVVCSSTRVWYQETVGGMIHCFQKRSFWFKQEF